jgi:hypothetical protein
MSTLSTLRVTVLLSPRTNVGNRGSESTREGKIEWENSREETGRRWRIDDEETIESDDRNGVIFQDNVRFSFTQVERSGVRVYRGEQEQEAGR